MPWLLLGFAAIGIASAVSWIYNEATDEEKRRQDYAQKRREDFVADYNDGVSIHTKNYQHQLTANAEKVMAIFLEEIAELSKKIGPISDALTQVFNMICNEVAADTTSPYRRSALLREYSQVEDAKARLVEYQEYLNHECRVIKKLWDEESYIEIINLDLANPVLPDEWLYEGKLVIVEMSEVGGPLPKFGHRLLFSGNKVQQQALATNYGAEFPLLVKNKGKKNDGAFFSCVARGICHYDYIMKGVPIEMRIERYLSKDKAYQGVLFDGLVTVKLPEISLLNPSMRSLSGQITNVYFDSYNTILTSNPAIKSKKNQWNIHPTMSEKPPAFLGQDELDLYVEVEDELLSSITDEAFYSERSLWTLKHCDLKTQEIILSKASVQLVCMPTDNSDGLRVKKVQQFPSTQVGVDLPFGFVLASKALEPNLYFSWPYGLEQLYSFASQALVNSETTQERVRQAEFFKRWEKVVQYQRRMESERSVEFDCTPEALEVTNQYSLVISKHEITMSAIDEQSVATLIKEIEKSEFLLATRCCRLMVWDKTQGMYVYAIEKHRVNEATFLLTSSGCLEIRASLVSRNRNIPLEQVHRFKLAVSLPSASLQRQEQALSALFEDRIVEPRLKDIFLSPSSYQTEYVEHWRSSEIKWNDSYMTKSQKHVVKTALSARHIAMVQGPPGTGKTTTIVEMLYQLISHNPNQRILVVSQQNTAVDNAISKFKRKYPEIVTNGVNIIRVGNPDKIDSDMKENHLDKVFNSFLAEKLDYISRRTHEWKDEAQVTSYEWAALLKQMKANIGTKKVSDEFFEIMLADKNLIGATCVGLAGQKAGIDHLAFDVAIVDEAGRATVPELLIPLLRSKKAILIGDHHQLPPSIAPILREDSAKQEMDFLKETFLESSFFEVLFDQLPDSCTASLKEQFRMSPPIGDLVAELFYTRDSERQLFNGAGDDFDSSNFAIRDCLVWRDVVGEQSRPKNSTSIENKLEAAAISIFLHQLAKKQSISIDVAVITPYGAQKRTIRRELEKGAENKSMITLRNLNIRVDTVDSFQGSEAELVLYSTVRTKGSLQFLLDKKRLNVACSRAKQTLIFFGHSEFLKRWRPGKGEKNLFVEILSHAKFYSPKTIGQRTQA